MSEADKIKRVTVGEITVFGDAPWAICVAALLAAEVTQATP